jgi:hypothetical protein
MNKKERIQELENEIGLTIQELKDLPKLLLEYTDFKVGDDFAVKLTESNYILCIPIQNIEVEAKK